jgi:hypothetical protein
MPYVLCGLIQRSQDKEADYRDRLAIEYWSNTMGWNFMEQLCTSFEIKRLIPKPTIYEKLMGRALYQKDNSIASRIV